MGRHFIRCASSMQKTAVAIKSIFTLWQEALILQQKQGVPDPEMNPSHPKGKLPKGLCTVPAHVIEECNQGKQWEAQARTTKEARYEGFGPSTVIIDCLKTTPIERLPISGRPSTRHTCQARVWRLSFMYDQLGVFVFKYEDSMVSSSSSFEMRVDVIELERR